MESTNKKTIKRGKQMNRVKRLARDPNFNNIFTEGIRNLASTATPGEKTSWLDAQQMDLPIVSSAHPSTGKNSLYDHCNKNIVFVSNAGVILRGVKVEMKKHKNNKEKE